MKHAFLIIAHGKWKQLQCLLKQIDASNHDIFVHIDKKCKYVPTEEIKKSVKLSRINIFSEYKVYWGSFELVQTELLLLREAQKYEYDYYHLLSGMDLIIKNKKYFNEFFEMNKGKEFVHFDTDDRLKKDKEILRRVKCYHFFTNYRRRFSKLKFLNEIFTFLERVSLTIQEILKVDRTKQYKNIKIKYGSQWFSITNDLAKYIIENEPLIYKIFHKTKCADELFIQTLVYNSTFKKKLYNTSFDDNPMSNARLIDIKNRGKNGNPYTWKITDYNEISKSKCLFARKFDPTIDANIIKKIFDDNIQEV